jgi:3D (Asp-Asp-Asp) domain-containing protein
MQTGYGVVAVDPKVIPLGSRLYIPGYGVATAGDTGSSIKGNKIDLGFDDVKNGWWSSRFVEIYILE